MGSPLQAFVAGLLLAAGLAWSTLVFVLPPYLLVVAHLFMLKVLYGFAVDHFPERT